LELINSKIFEKTIKLENIIDFFGETNKNCIELCEKIIRKNNKLKKHIKWSLNELQAGDPFKTITEKKIKYSFYCK